ncbi:MAG: EcsC family protein [Pseudomonadota bacterium]
MSTMTALVPTAVPPERWSAEDLEALRQAHRRLEHPSLAARLSHVVGSPFDQAARLFPQSWQRRARRAAESVLLRMLDGVAGSMERMPPHPSHPVLHRLLVMGTGAAGGFFGPAAVLAELPLTTALMLRAIADIAHAEGEDMSTREARLACVEVFALGGRSHEDDAADTGYYGLRLALALHLSQVGGYGAGAAVPGMLRFVQAVAARFGVVIADKAAAQAVPVAGAATGAALNLLFLRHFQDMARGHFVLRRLERSHGMEAVRREYERLERDEARNSKPFSHLEGW